MQALNKTDDFERIFSDYAAQRTESGDPLKPFISLSGDDDGKHYILHPATEDKDDWTYNMSLLVETGLNVLIIYHCSGACPIKLFYGRNLRIFVIS